LDNLEALFLLPSGEKVSPEATDEGRTDE